MSQRLNILEGAGSGGGADVIPPLPDIPHLPRRNLGTAIPAPAAGVPFLSPAGAIPDALRNQIIAGVPRSVPKRIAQRAANTSFSFADPGLAQEAPLVSLMDAAAKYMRKGLAPSTVKMYDSAWWFFRSFCMRFACPPLPLNIPLVCAFIVHSFESRKLKVPSIKALISGIQFHLRCQDPTVPSILSNPAIQLLINGIKKEQIQGNDHRLPITISVLHTMVGKLRSGLFSRYIDTMLEAVILLAFYAFLRCGEYTAKSLAFKPQHDLCFSDLTMECSHYSILLKQSKTDKFSEGTPVVVARTNSLFCPFNSMLRYLAARPMSAPNDPLFITDAGLPMTRNWFGMKLREICQSCGLPPARYTPHSLRIGAATTAALLVPSATIKSLGRWSSAAYVRYIRFSKPEILHAQQLTSNQALMAPDSE